MNKVKIQRAMWGLTGLMTGLMQPMSYSFGPIQRFRLCILICSKMQHLAAALVESEALDLAEEVMRSSNSISQMSLSAIDDIGHRRIEPKMIYLKQAEESAEQGLKVLHKIRDVLKIKV